MIKETVDKQRAYFLNGKTLSYESRKNALEQIYQSIKDHEEEVFDALYQDLGKNRVESYFSEIGQVYKELSYLRKHLKKLMKTKRVKSELSDFPASSFTSPHPYGVTLVISPWNYPFLLAMVPTLGAIAAGNTVIIKPSEFSVHTTKVIEKIVNGFDNQFLTVITGGVPETTELLNQKLDYIFFTGSGNVGKIVMEKASKHLTPISLELGGKSPVIIDKDANIKVSAKRVAFGKFLNAGQTCIAPDYVFVHKDIKEVFVKALKTSIHELYGDNPIESDDYGKIITKRHYNRLLSLVDGGSILEGGDKNEKNLKIAPTILDQVKMNSYIMKEEIFGPILPIIAYDKISEVIQYINQNDNPLALYLFTENKATEKIIMNHCNFGGGCINDTIVQAGSEYLPFGGVGESGIGSYHGQYTFKTFSHYRSVIKKSTKLDIAVRYAPYTKKKEKMMRRLLK